MNVEFFSRPLADLDVGMAAGAQGLDHWVGWFVHVFVRGKFWTMFSLLFGMGFAVMLSRAEARGASFAGPYLRRTVVLGAFGVLHYVFLWAGDILFSYALGAMLLVLVAIPAGLRRWPPARLRRAGLALYLLPFLAMTIGGGVMLAHPPQPTPQEQQAQAQRIQEHETRVAREARVLADGSYADAVALRADDFPRHLGSNAFFAVIVAGVFLLGAWFVRSGAMTDPAAHLGLFRTLACWGIPIGIGASLVAAGIATTLVRGHNDAAYMLATGLAMLGNLPASLGYIGAVVLAFHGRLRRWLAWFAPAGRMALTNYLLQSLLGTLFFHGYGLGQWGMGRAAQLVFVLVVFGLQLLLSRWWLARFRYGPMEWLWRAATYLRLPAFRAA